MLVNGAPVCVQQNKNTGLELEGEIFLGKLSLFVLLKAKNIGGSAFSLVVLNFWTPLYIMLTGKGFHMLHA